MPQKLLAPARHRLSRLFLVLSHPVCSLQKVDPTEFECLGSYGDARIIFDMFGNREFCEAVYFSVTWTSRHPVFRMIIFLIRFSTWLSQLKCISCGRRGLSNVNMFQNCSKLGDVLRKKYVLPKFWDNLDSRKAQIKNQIFGIFLHFICKAIWISNRNRGLRGSFSTKNQFCRLQ